MTGIGVNYQARTIAGLIGPAHSSLVTENPYGAWLDEDGEVIVMTGFEAPHAAFDIVDIEGERGVKNVIEIEGGEMPSTLPTYFAVMDAASVDDADVIAFGPVDFGDTPPAEGTVLIAPVGAVRILYTEAP